MFSISLVSLQQMKNGGYNIEKIKTVKIRCDKRSDILEVIKNHNSNNDELDELLVIVSDFLNIVPTYHSEVDLQELSKKIYTERSVNLLLDFVNKFDGNELYYQIEID
jgi:hypothetical protein